MFPEKRETLQGEPCILWDVPLKPFANSYAAQAALLTNAVDPLANTFPMA